MDEMEKTPIDELIEDIDKVRILQKLIYDAEWRIGSFIAAGGERNHTYVDKQVQKIEDWTKQIDAIVKEIE